MLPALPRGAGNRHLRSSNVPKLTVKQQIALLTLGVLAALWFWRHWQGPEVAATVVQQQALVQTVVASGEVRSQSLARIGSEITGTLKARHVREGDVVKPGDLLLELANDEQQARVREAEAALQLLGSSSRRQALAALAEAEANLAQAERERERRETLRERNLIPDEQVEQARRSELSARMVRDRAALQAKAGARPARAAAVTGRSSIPKAGRSPRRSGPWS